MSSYRIIQAQNIKTSSSGLYPVISRLRDVTLSALALILLLPVFLITALAIVIDDPTAGPFFTQLRCGKDGRLFRMYKFRSMEPDAEERLFELSGLNERDGPAFKIKNDPRVTRVGRFIRKTNIDELPQLLNIIKGDMSIVGPRPPLPSEVEKYTDRQRLRLTVKPGLSCYWQIRQCSEDISFEEWVAMDLKYISERSLSVDNRIIIRTLLAVIGAWSK